MIGKVRALTTEQSERYRKARSESAERLLRTSLAIESAPDLIAPGRIGLSGFLEMRQNQMDSTRIVSQLSGQVALALRTLAIELDPSSKDRIRDKPFAARSCEALASDLQEGTRALSAAVASILRMAGELDQDPTGMRAARVRAMRDQTLALTQLIDRSMWEYLAMIQPSQGQQSEQEGHP